MNMDTIENDIRNHFTPSDLAIVDGAGRTKDLTAEAQSSMYVLSQVLSATSLETGMASDPHSECSAKQEDDLGEQCKHQTTQQCEGCNCVVQG